MQETAKERLERIASGFQPARILLSAVELDLFTALGSERLTAAEIAKRTKTKPEPVGRILNALVGLEILAKSNGRFRNTPASRKHLTADAAKPLLHIMLHRVNMWETWGRLTEVARTGKAPPRKRTREKEDSFIRGMANIAATSAIATVKALKKELKSAKRLLDVGGGPAVYACEFARHTPGLTATVFDLPGPLEIAKETIRKRKLAKRVKTRPKDVLDDASFGRGYDVVFLSNLIHSFKRPDAAKVVKKSAGALKPGGRLVIKEFYIEKDGTQPPWASQFSINMLVADAGDCFSRKEVEEWMGSAGVKPSAFYEVAMFSGLLVGTKG